MAIKKAFLFIHDSVGNGVASLAAVPSADFGRWTGTSWPSTFPKDVTIPDVEVITPTLPYGATLTETVLDPPQVYVVDFESQTANLADPLAFSGGGTATLLGQVDSGATGTIWFSMLTGAPPVDGETITDGGSGDGTVDGTPVWAAYTATYDSQTADMVLGETVTFSGTGTALLIGQHDDGAAGTMGFQYMSGPVPADTETFTTASGDGTLTSTPALTDRKKFLNVSTGLAGIVDDTYLFTKVSSTASRGTLIEIDSYYSAGGVIMLVGTGLPVASVVGDTVEVWTDVRRVSAYNSTTRVITKLGTGVNDFSAADVGRWVVVVGGTGIGQGRRVAASPAPTADTLALDYDLLTNLDATSVIRVISGSTDVINSYSDLSTTDNFSLSPMSFYHDLTKWTYSNALEFPNWYGQPIISPAAHASNDAISYIPEVMWRMRADTEGKIYCVCVGAGGATLTPYNIGADVSALVLNNYSWGADVEHNDWRPGSSNGLYVALQRYVEALDARLPDGDTLSVEGVFVTIGTNDASNEDRANEFLPAMRRLRQSLREWLVSDGYSQINAESIRWMMASAADSRTYATTVNAAMIACAADDAASIYVDVSDFSSTDGVHLNNVGALQLGEAFGDAWEAAGKAADATAPDHARPTLAELRTRVKRRFEGSTSSNAANTTRVDQFINDAINEIHMDIGDNAWFLRRVETISTLSAVWPATLVMQGNIDRLLRIESSSYPGREVPWDGVSLKDNGRTEITLKGAASGPFEVHYITFPEDLTGADDRAMIPTLYCEWVVVLTCLRLHESSGNASMVSNYAGLASISRSRVKRDCLRRDRMRNGALTTTGSPDDMTGINSTYWNL